MRITMQYSIIVSIYCCIDTYCRSLLVTAILAGMRHHNNVKYNPTIVTDKCYIIICSWVHICIIIMCLSTYKVTYVHNYAVSCTIIATSKQRGSSIISSISYKPAQLSTASSTRSIGTATSDFSFCPFSAPQWNVTILSHKFDHNGGTLHIHEHDIDIVIPKDAICMGDVVEVHAAAILSGPYKVPSKHDPISVTVWVGASYKFNLLIKISIPHCAVINGPQDINGLVILTATTGEEKFTVNTNSRRLSQCVDQANCYCYGVKNPYCDYYTYELNSSVCLARRSFQLTTLSIMVFCSKPHDYQSADKLPVEFCFCYNLRHCVKVSLCTNSF